MSWEGLPEEVWKLILQNVPLRERLCICATVSKALHRAAVAATDQLEVSLLNFSSMTEVFWMWMGRYEEHITTLAVSGTRSNILLLLSQLPCQHLCQLELSYCSIQVWPSSSQPGVQQVCTALTQLVLDRCYLIDGCTSLAALSAVPTLQHLELHHLHGDEAPHDREIDLPAPVMCCLQQLTHLRVERTKVCLQHISCLRNLQQLILHSTTDVTPSTTPGLDQLTALQDLELRSGTLDPAALHACSTLQRLSLVFVRLSSSEDGTQSLLCLIGRQQQLRQLYLCLPNHVWPPVPSAYTALSASSKLQQLFLLACNLPARAWQQGVFRPGWQLPDLHTFELSDTSILLSQQDVAALVSCCPALRGISIALQPGGQLTALAPLTGLADLELSDADATSCSCLSALSKVRSLSKLIVGCSGHLGTAALLPPRHSCSPATSAQLLSCHLGTAALLPLTLLRSLTDLGVYCDDFGWQFLNKGPASEPAWDVM